MASKPAVSHRSPVRNLPRPEPRLPSAVLHADDRVMSWLGRLYGGDAAARAELIDREAREAEVQVQRQVERDDEGRSRHGLDAPFDHDSEHLNPHDVLLAFIHAARAGRERHFEAIESGAEVWMVG